MPMFAAETAGQEQLPGVIGQILISNRSSARCLTFLMALQLPELAESS